MQRPGLGAVGRAVTALAATALLAAGLGAQPSVAQDAVVAHFDFEDGLQGWTVIDRSGSSSWAHTDAGHQSTGAVRIHPYADDSSTVLVSPPIEAPEGSILVFEANWWLDSDHVLVVDAPAGTDFSEPTSGGRELSGRGRAPFWDQFRYALGSSGAIQIAFDLQTDAYCSGAPRREEGTWRLVTNHCGTGMAIDNVQIVSPEMAATLGPAWGDAPGTSRRVAPTPAGPDDGNISGIAEWLVAGSASRAPSARPDDEFADQQANLEFQQAWASLGPVRDLDDWWSDPLLTDWDGERGRRQDVWVRSRYDTPLAGIMFAPLDDGPHPLVVFLGGAGAANWPGYFPWLQRLAEEGFVVLSVAWQGEGTTTRRAGAWPAPEFCADPEVGATTWWRQPQEAGFVETQHCAGTASAPWFGDDDAFADAYETAFGAVTTFAAIDAVDWATSDENPWRHLVDGTRVGTIGHSAGTIGAYVAAQVDDRIQAAIPVDGYGRLPERVAPTTPVLTVNFDGYGTSLPLATNPESVSLRLRDAGVDAGFLFLQDASHFDLAWEPEHSRASFYAARNTLNHGNVRAPLVKPMLQHWSLAWFDLHLRGDPTAVERLTAASFDGSADRTARGTGRWDPVVGNVPYTLEGVEVVPQLNPEMTSWIRLAGEDHVLAGGELPARGGSGAGRTDAGPPATSSAPLPVTGGGSAIGLILALAATRLQSARHRWSAPST